MESYLSSCAVIRFVALLEDRPLMKLQKLVISSERDLEHYQGLIATYRQARWMPKTT